MVPTDGELRYEEGVFIGYRAWEQAGRTPSYPFGHGLGYTDWAYEAIEVDGASVSVTLRNSGGRAGREVVQVYLAPVGGSRARPARWLAGFASVTAAPGEIVRVAIALADRAFEIWDGEGWSRIVGGYEAHVGRSVADLRLTAPITT